MTGQPMQQQQTRPLPRRRFSRSLHLRSGNPQDGPPPPFACPSPPFPQVLKAERLVQNHEADPRLTARNFYLTIRLFLKGCTVS